MKQVFNRKGQTKGQALIDSLKLLYEQFGEDSLEHLGEIYTQDIEFIDPVHSINGLLGLKRYFRSLVKNSSGCRFRYLNELVADEYAYITWEMSFSHPRLARGKEIILPGVTELGFSNRVYYHRDYYDLGAMAYEHIPVLGQMVKGVKGRLA